MALDPAGGVVVGGYVGTTSTHGTCVARFDANGALGWEWIPGTQASDCRWIAVDPGGDVVVRTNEYATDSWTLHRLTSSGALSWSVGIGNSQAIGPHIDSASNLVYAVNGSWPGTKVIEKRNAAGALLWSKDAALLFGTMYGTASLDVDANDDIVAMGMSGVILRLDPNGGLRWSTTFPPAAWFDKGAGHIQLDRNGDAVGFGHGLAQGLFQSYDSIARWDAAGNFLWSQSVRGVEPGTEVNSYAMALAPHGSVVSAGYSQKVGAPKDLFVAAVRQASRLTCFGDGSSGPCPCNNNVPPGTPSGCRNAQTTIGARLDDQGIASLGSDSLRFWVSGLPGNGIALFLQGLPAASPVPFQDGRMCVTGRITRLYAAAVTGHYLDLAPAGGPGISARSAALGDVIQPGTSRAYQLFYRNGTATCVAGNGNLTNAVVVDWAQ